MRSERECVCDWGNEEMRGSEREGVWLREWEWEWENEGIGDRKHCSNGETVQKYRR